MPVAQLFIEGITPTENSVGKGLDFRLLGKLLGGLCRVIPRGSKYGMDAQIWATRAVGVQSYALLDGDFQEPWPGPREEPIPWPSPTEKAIDLLGWRWSRKEIENYLLDPGVVQKALHLDPLRYEAVLMQACDDIAPYQAARMALSSVRPRPNTLDNRWGRPRGNARYPFPEPSDRTETACKEQLAKLVEALGPLRLPKSASEAYTRACEARGVPMPSPIKLSDLLEFAHTRFAALLPECLPTGSRGQNALTCFSGKDLLWAMDLQALGFASPTVFLEHVMVAVEDSRDDVWTWLPEWSSLRARVQST